MKTQEQLLGEALELILMIDGLKDSHVRDIMKLMISKQFTDNAGVPLTDNMTIIGGDMNDYQKAILTLADSTLNDIDECLDMHKTRELDVFAKRRRRFLNEMYDSLVSEFWESILQTHWHYFNPNNELLQIEGFQIAEVQNSVCPHCGGKCTQGERTNDNVKIINDIDGLTIVIPHPS